MNDGSDQAAGIGDHEALLLELLAALKAQGFRFVTPTPDTQACVVARAGDATARTLRDAFGWNLRFAAELIEPRLAERLAAADLIEAGDEGLRSRLRVSSRGPDLFLHSGFPTSGRDAVFFGPDSYRFASLIDRELARAPQRPGATLVDMGTGSGIGAIVAARSCPALALTMTDINPVAIALARINAKAAEVTARFQLGAGLAAVAGRFDVILANPPYIIDAAGRSYRDGGGMLGAAVSLDMAREAVARLAPGGRLILYTGSAIVAGEDALGGELARLAGERGCSLRYDEIDPDIFGEELRTEAYRDVERIAAVSAVIERPA